MLEDNKCIRDKKLKASSDEEMSYEDYCKLYKKEYSEEEKKKRQVIYDTRIESIQSMSMPYDQSINNLTDWTKEEIQKMTNFKYTGNKFGSGQSSKKIKSEGPKLGYPSSLNWTAEGVVTSIKNQGSCGSCWAFGAAANAESVLIMNGWQNIGIDLSEQYLVECTYESSCDGTYYVEYVMQETLKGLPR